MTMTTAALPGVPYPTGWVYRIASVNDYGGEFNVAVAAPKARPAPKYAAPQYARTALAETVKVV